MKATLLYLLTAFSLNAATVMIDGITSVTDPRVTVEVTQEPNGNQTYTYTFDGRTIGGRDLSHASISLRCVSIDIIDSSANVVFTPERNGLWFKWDDMNIGMAPDVVFSVTTNTLPSYNRLEIKAGQNYYHDGIVGPGCEPVHVPEPSTLMSLSAISLIFMRRVR